MTNPTQTAQTTRRPYADLINAVLHGSPRHTEIPRLTPRVIEQDLVLDGDHVRVKPRGVLEGLRIGLILAEQAEFGGLQQMAHTNMWGVARHITRFDEAVVLGAELRSAGDGRVVELLTEGCTVALHFALLSMSGTRASHQSVTRQVAELILSDDLSLGAACDAFEGADRSSWTGAQRQEAEQFVAGLRARLAAGVQA